MDQTLRDDCPSGLVAALRAEWAVLQAGGAALDAVTMAVMALEDNPLFNAGRGTVLTVVGTIEMDAAIMSGADRAGGAVAGICGPRNPILAARAVMEHAGTVMMTGAGAQEFLASQEIEWAAPDYFVTALRLDLDRRAAGAPDTRSDADRHGTVGGGTPPIWRNYRWRHDRQPDPDAASIGVAPGRITITGPAHAGTRGTVENAKHCSRPRRNGHHHRCQLCGR